MKEEFDKEEKEKLKKIMELLNKIINIKDLTSKNFIDFQKKRKRIKI